ncbi:MAG: DJ-1/PfpI family protein [Deltaproteobacteria bacterium]|nr:DJ-1/PfpI family protein [Deltaproteobacteria bacterium]
MALKVLIPISTGFEEIETATIVDVLRRAGLNVTLAGLTPGLIEGRSAIQIQPDCSIDDALKTMDYDAVVLPGGQPNAGTLARDSRVINLLQRMDSAQKTVAAICAAPAALSQAGLLDTRKATIYPGCVDDLPPGSYVEQDVVISENIVTSRGPATAMAFALALVERLCGGATASTVSKALLAS